MIDREKLTYRPCVGVMLLNKHGEVFVGMRIDSRADAWQMPLGGIDDGEDVEAAAFREIEEEIGTNNMEIIAKTKDWYSYDIPDFLIEKFWGGKYRGQTQMWFLAKFKGDDRDIDVNTRHPEFCKWQWVGYESLPDLAVPFKRELYKNLLIEFAEHLKGK